MCIHPRAGNSSENRTVVSGQTGLGVDLNTTATKRRISILCGEKIRVDLDVGDSGFRRKMHPTFAGLESIDGDGDGERAACQCGGKLLQFAEQIIRVISERLQTISRDGLRRAR